MAVQLSSMNKKLGVDLELIVAESATRGKSILDVVEY